LYKEGKADFKEIISGMVPASDYQGFQPAVMTMPIAEDSGNDQ
jgi:hypothetical protein